MARFHGFTKKNSTMSKLIAPLFFLLILALFSPEGSAQIYKYVDKDGTVHFTNTPTDPGYKSYMGDEPEKKEVSNIQSGRPANNNTTPSKGSDDLGNLDDLDDLDNLDKLDELEELPPLPAIP
jgi:hypothetical protein